jgi:hypothetical protein
LNKNILNTGVQVFIENNLNADILSVMLSGPTFQEISQKQLVQQIESKKKAQSKLPTWFNTPLIYYPNKLHIEQTSSEITARYKASLVAGKTLADLTGGFGVDAYFFSQKMSRVYHCEWDKELCQIVSHNNSKLRVDNMETRCIDGIEFLKNTELEFDWIYLDPSRRDISKNKVYKLEDCTPNISLHIDLIFSRTKQLLLKTSPLLDLTAGLSELQQVHEIHVVAVNNEVKELLWILKNAAVPGDLPVKTINITNKGDEVFNFYWQKEKQAISDFSKPLRYLYEPNAAVLKSGGFKILGVTLGLKKLHEHSHLYTSDTLIEFPGRTFEVLQTIPYNKKNMKVFKNLKANVTTRNFLESVAQLRKQYKILDGGNHYLFFTTDSTEKRILIKCRKI